MMMKKAITLIALMVTISCGQPDPVRQEFERIWAKEYIPHVYDCSNKAAEFLTWLQENGYTNSRIWYWFEDGNSYGHCVVECNGTIYDATSGEWHGNIERVRELATAIEYSQLKAAQSIFPDEWSF